ncbi:RNA polymerase I-specific transcription initiation factor RRN3-like [Tubulanus polymorphus]|uniref:RNA polymerase I-specific transcription initiation factor RRN3-like n=1 Tax=Tubulanus polymorphus TaxID=672921 RepID=UPI003DA3165E
MMESQTFESPDSIGYNAIMEKLNDPLLSDSSMISVMQLLKNGITTLDKHWECLIGYILKLDWLRRDTLVVIEYKTFIVNLVSAHTYFLKACLKSFVNQFKPGNAKKVGASAGVSPDSMRTIHGTAFINIHSVLQAIIKIVPLTPTVLVPILVDSYPLLTRPAYQHECYIKNLLHIARYLPQCRRKILVLIIGKLMELDSQSPRRAVQDALDENEEEDDGDMNVDNEESDIFRTDDVKVKEESELASNQRDTELSHVEAHKLDVAMELLLHNITDTCIISGQLNWEETKKLYKELLGVFEDVILVTHSSSHVQYLLFYICSFKQPLADGFIDYLWKKVKNPNTQPIYRQAAVAYMCGLISRGLFVPISTAVVTMEHMSQWIHSYIQQSSYSECDDVPRHGTFYSVCQALFYIFIFRHKEILQSNKGHQIAQNLNFPSIVMCWLNPLKTCLPVIVKTFAAVTRQHQLAFCDTIIEHNKPTAFPVTKLYTTYIINSRTNQLESFFPFDPYILPRSKHAIEPLYREYSGNPIEDDDNDSAGEDDDFLGDTSLIESKSPTEFLVYRTSPGL